MMKTITIILTLLFSLYIHSIKAQCSSSGPLPGSIASNNTSIGSVSWNAVGNVSASDNSRAIANALLIGDKTNYLVITGFGFTIPTPSSICGIEVEVEGSASGLLQIVKDNSIKIVKAGVITGADKAGSATWPNSDAFNTYGSNSDLWGNTWIESDINSSNFGVAISADLTSLSALPAARIDFVRITVYYQSTLPITLSAFNAIRKENDAVELTWETQVEINNDFFTIERSLDGYVWDGIGRLRGAGNSEVLLSYRFIDENPFNESSYYRLKQTDYTGNFVYSKVLDVKASYNRTNTFNVYPNPFSEELIINAIHMDKPSEFIIIEAESGKRVVEHPLEPTKMNFINTSRLDKGIYFITIVDGDSFNKPTKFIKSN